MKIFQLVRGCTGWDILLFLYQQQGRPRRRPSITAGLTMRISDDRYSRDRFRLDLALRFIRHEARTQTIRAWTGLSDDRIRKLYRGYLNEPGFAVSRPRGKSPQQCAFFTRSQKLQEESSLLASLCSLLGVLPRTGTPLNRQALVNLSRGELLCQVFEVYRELVTDPSISFEHLVFLVCALTGGEELSLANCEQCGALTVVDRMSFKAHHCLHCASGAG
jgi:Flagellar transcriptional activator (FlhC)